ncbi:hypothetical protein [Dermatobacter hominis]|uniref:hypothetical protein n=1 Tax=Dermatobacter hominis TaxID=2884263 RepID=UPI001D11DD70|nr:hypothetical protein [Dermatobacter hominis]UDY34096.1 hypothetical protein LH044_12160 [Dermatobacter hominis]
MAPATKSKKRVVTDEHKAAMAAGRTEARAVKNYLDALEVTRPKRGRKRTPDSINQRLVKISAELDTASDPMKRLSLTQERIDLERELGTLESKVDIDMTALEKAFVGAAASYSARKGITYAAWREVGVPAATLKAAGISRAS